MKYFFISLIIFFFIISFLGRLLARFRPVKLESLKRQKKYLLLSSFVFFIIFTTCVFIGFVQNDTSYFTLSVFPLLLVALMLNHRHKL